jgi:hypothetical protein
MIFPKASRSFDGTPKAVPSELIVSLAAGFETHYSLRFQTLTCPTCWPSSLI